MKFLPENIAGYVQSGWQLFMHIVTAFIRVSVDISTDVIFGLIYRNGKKTLPPIHDHIVLESATSLAARIRTRKLTSRKVVESFINRIKEVNPILNAVVHDNFERALQEAKKVDELIASGVKSEHRLEVETPFLGVPFTSKDSIAVKGQRQTCCLVSRKDVIAEEDADAIRLMRNAGAIHVGTTNTSEICSWWESTNNVYGTTHNPYDTTRSAAGSSGGEGAIIGAAGSVIGIGSDIGGSIRIPAAFNGIFGHKPTGGLVNSEGELPASVGETHKISTIGPLCRYATDLLPLFKILVHKDVAKLKLNDEVRISSLKVFYKFDDSGAPNVSSVNYETKKALAKIVDYLETTHGLQCEKVNLTKLQYSTDIWMEKMAASGRPPISEELAAGKGTVNCKWELAKWFVGRSDFTIPSICLGLKKDDVTTEAHKAVIQMFDELDREFEELLGSDGVFLYPTHPRPPPYHHQSLFMPFNFSYAGAFNILTYPSCSCTLGLDSYGLPLAIQVVANKYNDRFCLAMALELERAFGGWVSPSVVS